MQLTSDVASPTQLGREERVALRCGCKRGDGIVVGRCTERDRQQPERVGVQRPQVDGRRCAMPGRTRDRALHPWTRRVGTEGEDDHGSSFGPLGQLGQHPQRAVVGPVRIVDHDHHTLPRGQDHLLHGTQHLMPGE